MAYSNYPVAQQPKKTGLGCGCAFFLIVLLVAGLYSGYRYYSDQNNYTKAHEAYLQADCKTALEAFDSIINAWRVADIGNFANLSRSEGVECQAFQNAADKQSSGDPSGAILIYNDFVNNYGSSPLAPEARKRISSIFSQANVKTLANEALCNQLSYLEQENIIPQKNTLLPNLLFECGNTYTKISDYYSAIQMYEDFLSRYSTHSLAPHVEEALANAIIADARASGAGIIAPPQQSGSTSGGSTVVIIQNDSPERLRLVFSGPETRIEEIAPCATCTTFTGIGPLYCPEQGPIGSYTLPPGQYEVVVQVISDSGVTPYQGDWELISGDEYYSCFFITVSSFP